MRLTSLFIVTAVAEGTTGLLLLLAPTVVFAFLVGWREIGVETALIGRVAGGAVLGLGVASWLGREDTGTRAQRALLAGLLIYNVVATVVLVYAGAALGAVGVLLWPAVVYHVALAVWSIACVRSPSASTRG